jgi:YegS/Rv2252/BmrU family lipid kinase
MQPMAEKKHITFIANSLAVSASYSEFNNLVEKHLDRSVYDYNIHFTEKEGDAERFAFDSVSRSSSVLVAVGGDGTVNEISRALIGTDTKLGIIPYGSGNGLARHLGIPLITRKAFEILNQGITTSIDTGTINNINFVNVAGAGFDAKVANRYAKSGERGFKSYFRIIVTEYLSYKPREFSITFNDRKIIRKAIFVSFANSSQFGYNTVIAPGASLKDGLIDLVIVKRFPSIEIPRAIHLLYTNKIDHSEYVERYRSDEITLERSKGQKVNIDGEAVNMGKSLQVKVNPLSMQVIVPENFTD